MYTLYKKLKELGIYSYKEYLESKHWKDLKERYYKSKLPRKCYICGNWEGLQLHHKTYKRLGKERLMDIIPLCNDCHYILHQLIKDKKISLWTATRRFRKRILRIKERL